MFQHGQGISHPWLCTSARRPPLALALRAASLDQALAWLDTSFSTVLPTYGPDTVAPGQLDSEVVAVLR